MPGWWRGPCRRWRRRRRRWQGVRESLASLTTPGTRRPHGPRGCRPGWRLSNRNARLRQPRFSLFFPRGQTTYNAQTGQTGQTGRGEAERMWGDTRDVRVRRPGRRGAAQIKTYELPERYIVSTAGNPVLCNMYSYLVRGICVIYPPFDRNVETTGCGLRHFCADRPGVYWCRWCSCRKSPMRSDAFALCVTLEG